MSSQIAFGVHAGAARHAADERHLAEVLARAERVRRCRRGTHGHVPESTMNSSSPASPSLMTNSPACEGAHLGDLHHAQQLALGEAREQRHLGEHLALERELLGALVVGLGPLAEAHHDARDVVFAARFVGELDERRDRGVAVGFRRNRARALRGSSR